MKLKLVSIFVDDQDKALAFYTDVLGFKKKTDIPVGPGARWITVVSGDARDDLELVLEPNANPIAKTYQEGLFKSGIPATAFESDDLKREHAELKRRGVVFTMEPKDAGPVRIAIFSDTCGNLIQLFQPK